VRPRQSKEIVDPAEAVSAEPQPKAVAERLAKLIDSSPGVRDVAPSTRRATATTGP
jgi:hypothetical protein